MPWTPPACGPTVITPGPDGALWFTRSRDHRIGRITTDGRRDSFPLPTPDSGPVRHHRRPRRRDVVHRDEHRPDRPHHQRRESHRVHAACRRRVPLRDHRRTRRRSVVHPQPGERDRPHQRSTATSPFTLCPPPAPRRSASPATATARCGSSRSARARSAGSRRTGEIEEFPLPDRDGQTPRHHRRPAGDCWFTEWGANRVGHITATGEIAEYDLPSPHPNRTASPSVPTARSGWPWRREGWRGWRRSPRPMAGSGRARPPRRSYWWRSSRADGCSAPSPGAPRDRACASWPHAPTRASSGCWRSRPPHADVVSPAPS